jgi:hypothetical protein
VIVCRADVEIYLSYMANDPKKDRTVQLFNKMLESIQRVP